LDQLSRQVLEREQRARARYRALRELNGRRLAALDDFRDWFGWACGPRNVMKIRRGTIAHCWIMNFRMRLILI
jgi:hypothetical protein